MSNLKFKNSLDILIIHALPPKSIRRSAVEEADLIFQEMHLTIITLYIIAQTRCLIMSKKVIMMR